MPPSACASAPALISPFPAVRPPFPSKREGLFANPHPMEGDFRLWDRFPSVPVLAREHQGRPFRPLRALHLKADSGAAAPPDPSAREGLLADQHLMEGHFRLRDRFPSLPADHETAESVPRGWPRHRHAHIPHPAGNAGCPGPPRRRSRGVRCYGLRISWCGDGRGSP